MALVNIFTVHGELIFQSEEEQVSLLELYTSEGCSSCPPAEAWLSQLKNDPGLWKTFVPLGLHVDYWDHLGWRDPWSAKEFTARQRLYAQAWKSSTIYTPGFVLNGAEWRDWSGRKLPPPTKARPGVLKLRTEDLQKWEVNFTPQAAAPEKRFEIHGALLASALTSQVKSGENSGRRLEHDFVVLKLVNERLKRSNGIYRGKIVLDAKSASGKGAIGVWITESGRLTPLQSTGGWLK